MADVEAAPGRIIDRLTDWLQGASLPPDGRLPPERALCAELGVSRAELRKALAILEARGHLDRQVGRGTFFRGPSDGPIDPDHRRLAERTSPHEAMTARLALEPELASLAAIHATPRQLAEAQALSDAMRGAATWADYERLDKDFHALIAQASGNALLTDLHRIVNAVRASVVWGKLQIPPEGPPADYHSFGEHEEIVDAIRRHDRALAHAAMRRHLKAILAAMIFED